jgi:DNA-binding response OmpR family regulator
MTSNSTKICFGHWTLDRIGMQIFDEKGKSGQLTFKEFCLLEVLVLSPNVPLSRKQLLKLARGNYNQLWSDLKSGKYANKYCTVSKYG